MSELITKRLFDEVSIDCDDENYDSDCDNPKLCCRRYCHTNRSGDPDGGQTIAEIIKEGKEGSFS